MKKIALILATTLMLTSCTSSTFYGECIGYGEAEEPGLRYEYSTWNIIVGAIFFETIFVPVIIVLNDLKCPVSKKDK